jgi:hypothetical protein
MKPAIVQILCILGTMASIDFHSTRTRKKITIVIPSFYYIQCTLCSLQPARGTGPLDCNDIDISSDTALASLLSLSWSTETKREHLEARLISTVLSVQYQQATTTLHERL